MQTKEKVLRKNVEVSVFFQVLKGYLFGEGVFVEIENSRIKNIFTNGDEENENIAKALYYIEGDLNSLGLNIKEVAMEPEIVQDKLLEAFNFDVVEMPFDIIDEGEELLIESLSDDAENSDSVSVDEQEESADSNETKSVNLSSLMEQQIKEAEESKRNSRVAAEDEADTHERIENVVGEVEVDSDSVVNAATEQPEPESAQEEVTENTKVETAEKRMPAYFYNDEEIEAYLSGFDLNENIIKWALKVRRENRERLVDAPQEVFDVVGNTLSFIGKREVIEKSLASMLVDQPLNLKGPAGTGKNTLLNTISTILNYPLFSINGSLESNKATLVGEHDIKEKGLLTVKDGQLTKAAIYGGMLFIDEINMIRPDILSIINDFAEKGKSFYNDVRGETIFSHPSTRLVSALNVGYAGVKKMNEATMDRMVSIQLEYLSKYEFREILKGLAEEQDVYFFDNLSLVDIEKILKIYTHLTNAAEEMIIPELATSARNIIQIAKLVPILGYQGAIEMVLDKFDEEESAMIVGVLSKDGLADELGFDVTKYLTE